MIEDIFSGLAKDINDSVQKVLSSSEVSDLKDTVRSSFQSVTQETAKWEQERARQQESLRRQQQQNQARQAAMQEKFRRQREEQEQRRRQWEEQRRQQRMRQEQWQAQQARQQQMQQTQRPAHSWQYTGSVVEKRMQLAPIRSGGAVFQTIVGGAAVCGTGMMAVRALLAYQAYGSFFNMLQTCLWAAGFIFSLWLLLHGTYRMRLSNRFRHYRKQLEGRDFCKISELSEASGVSEKRAVKDLQQMVSRKLLPAGYFDEKRTCVILNPETYEQYLKTQENARRMQEEQEKNPEKAAVMQVVAEGNRYIWRIREINAELPEEEISRQLDELAAICQKIFSYVEEHPQKQAAIRKFISYYLPTTLKLLEAYCNLERRQITTEEANNTRLEIKRALKNITLAFENLFSELIKDDLFDLSADISVLETMLSQEGLMDGADSEETDGSPLHL